MTVLDSLPNAPQLIVRLVAQRHWMVGNFNVNFVLHLSTCVAGCNQSYRWKIRIHTCVCLKKTGFPLYCGNMNVEVSHSCLVSISCQRSQIKRHLSPHHAVPLAVSSQRLHQVFLAAEAEVLDGLSDAAERAVDLVWVQVFTVVLQHAAAREKQACELVLRNWKGFIIRGNSIWSEICGSSFFKHFGWT